MARNTSEPLFIFKSGPLVHFSVDSSEIWMTTKLAHKDTKFLPFNLGSNGAGNSGSDGNPPAPEGKYQTYYLW
jgi:type I restriction enzyme, R subunit